MLDLNRIAFFHGRQRFAERFGLLGYVFGQRRKLVLVMAEVRHAFTKLGVRSRVELARLVAAEDD